MRYRSWLFLSLLVASAVVIAGPAAAQSGGYGNSDQAEITSTITASLAPPPYHRPNQWLDVGAVLPTGDFKARNYSAGFGLRFSQEFLQRSSYSLLGSLGLNWVSNTYFNEEQTDMNFAGPLGQQQGPVGSYKWWGIPYSMEIQWDPMGESHNGIFVSAGPSGQITRESKVLQESVLYLGEGGDSLGLPVIINGEALMATQAINNTKFHLGYAIHAGFRGRVGGGYNPLYMRLVAGWNSWYERSSPLSLFTVALSFGR